MEPTDVNDNVTEQKTEIQEPAAVVEVCIDQPNPEQEVRDEISQKDRAAFVLITGVPFLVIAMLVLWAGLYGLREPLNLFESVSIDTYNHIKIILSIIVLMFAVASINKGWLTEGLLFLFVGASSLTTAFCIKLGFSNVNELDTVFGIVVIVCSLFIIAREAKYRGYASLFAGLAIFVPNVMPFDASYLSATLLVISGVLFFIYFGIVMFYLETGDRKYSSALGDPKRGYVSNSYEVVLVVGFLTIGLILVFDGITQMNDNLMWNSAVAVAAFILSIVSLIMAVYASLKGEAPEALLILMISIYYLFMVILVFFDQTGAPLVVEMVTSAVILSTVVVFLKRHNWMLSVIAVLACVQGLIISPIVAGESSFISGCFSVIEAALCIYIALSIWCVVELKMEVLPITDSFGGDKPDE